MPFHRPRPKNEKNSKKINRFVIMGDSLSDRGTLEKRKLFGVIPLGPLSGLDLSPRGRFTNGYTWSDDVSNWFVEDAFIRRTKAHQMRTDDISDAIITHDKRIYDSFVSQYNLDDDKKVNFNGKNYVRSYAEGGLTSHDYSWHLSSSIKRFFTRLVVSTLSEKRDKLLKDDKAQHISLKEKAHSLVIEWTGANDLMTVNKEPSIKEADDAIADRIKNVKKLMAQGYRNFALFNMPDLSLTPRYQRLGKEDSNIQENAKKVSEYFNEKLQQEMASLQKQFPHCSFDVFDVNKYFTQGYEDPQSFGFDENFNKTTPFTESKDFEIYDANAKNEKVPDNNPDHEVSPGEGYMFWDDVHPTANMHAKIAEFFYDEYSAKYSFDFRPDYQEIDINPVELLTLFEKKYQELLAKDRHGFFGCVRRTHLERTLQEYPQDPLASSEDNAQIKLNGIFDHALNHHGERTMRALQQLGWLCGDEVANIKALNVAMHAARALYSGKANTQLELHDSKRDAKGESDSLVQSAPW
jgi:phospholipase/lecithinase/hemolysin